MKRKSKEPIKPLESVLAGVIADLGIGGRLKQFEVVDRWHAIVGEQISRVTVPERMEGGRLFVHVTRSTWRNELVFLKAELIARINKELGQEIVQDIIFR